MRLANLAKRWVPPALFDAIRLLMGRAIYLRGHFDDWETACAHSRGYDAEEIFDRVKQAALKVQAGEAAYERDSIVFDKVEYSFPVLASLQKAALNNGNKLRVLDFGGSLGSSYQQYRGILSNLELLRWGVVEQAHFVACGRASFETNELRFFSSITECVSELSPDIALLSSVLQYVERPSQVLEELATSGIPFVVIDRTPFGEHDHDKLTVQHVPRKIYRGSYPCWIFSKEAFRKNIAQRYRLVLEFENGDKATWIGGRSPQFGGMLLQSKC